jgi:hypothetical protein
MYACTTKKKFAAVGGLSKIRGGHLLENKASLPREKYEKRNRKKERKFDQERGRIGKNAKGTKKRQKRKLSFFLYIFHEWCKYFNILI